MSVITENDTMAPVAILSKMVPVAKCLHGILHVSMLDFNMGLYKCFPLPKTYNFHPVGQNGLLTPQQYLIQESSLSNWDPIFGDNC